jgi:predicted small lipoprotein YifL
MFGRTATRVLAVVVALAIGLAACAAGEPRYFPPGTLGAGVASLDGLRARWYSKHLKAMSERPIALENGRRTYRLLWLRTFHHPVAIRIVATKDTQTVYATELDGAGGYEPGKVLRKVSRDLSASEFSDFEAFLEASGFWEMASSQVPEGLDGAQWIVEAATDKYHVVDRWSPTPGPIRAIGDRFLSLVSWRYDPREVY